MTKEAEVKRFNEENPIGTTMLVRMDDGTQHEGTLIHPAQLLSGHSPVAWVSGLSGAYLLSRVRRAP